MAKEDSFLGIMDILNGYCDDVQEEIRKEADAVVKYGVKQLKDNSPLNKKNSKNRGRYAKGWAVKKESGRGFFKYKIHNKTDWQLTHLLENGHMARDGSFVKPVTHIKPVDEYVQKEYLNRVKNGIKNVSK